MSPGDEELLAKEGILDDEFHLGAREIRDETTAWASGSAGFRSERSLNKPPTGTANAAEDFKHVLPERHEHGCQ